MTTLWSTMTAAALAVTLTGSVSAFQSKAPDPSTAATVAGKWSAVLETPHGTMPVTFELKLDGKTVTGTFTSEQTGALPLKGQYLDGKLTYSISGGPGELEFNGKLKDRDAITGILSSHVGDLVVNATRVPDKSGG
jgi:hypothetical protein